MPSPPTTSPPLDLSLFLMKSSKRCEMKSMCHILFRGPSEMTNDRNSNHQQVLQHIF